MMRNLAHPTDLARRFQALADPTRLRILELIAGRERCVCELTDALDAAQSRLSFHLKALKTAGLVSDRRDGRWVYYSIVPEALDELATFLTGASRSEFSWSASTGESCGSSGCCG